MVERLAACPLVFQPGTQWRYSNATDVLGYLIEVVTKQSFPDFVRDRILKPLQMHDTAFYVPAEKRSRLAPCYTVPGGQAGKVDITQPQRQTGGLQRMDLDAAYNEPPPIADGGGGLVSTLGDFLKFCRMLLNKGCAEDGSTRLLGRKTVEYMMRNQLQGDLADYGMPYFLNVAWHGIGFGLGFAVVADCTKVKANVSDGECSWGGMASTFFWIDPRENLACVFLTQLVPSSSYPFRRQLRSLVNAALS